ncbi:restriction endonuclease [Azospirillum sp. 11R-A]|uniref:restriction endonuclease n=1 Tax=Azospirillum sp. 11R-A TaxID=3111634 RepID=UPI003C2CABF1
MTAPDISIETLRENLARFWDRRTHLSAQQAEDLVADILRDYYGADVTKVTANANAADGGVDLIVASRDGVIRRAVQVKRRLMRDVESVQDVRNFVGALLLLGEREGTFVTTASRFSSHALKIPRNSNLSRAKLQLELIDGERLCELIQHSATQGELKLPSLMSLDQQWVASDGSVVGARELFLGDIRQIQHFARKRS